MITMKCARLSCFVAIDLIGCSVEMFNFICEWPLELDMNGSIDNNDIQNNDPLFRIHSDLDSVDKSITK